MARAEVQEPAQIRACRPFEETNAAQDEHGWEFPRAGVRRRPDGRWQMMLWLDEVTPERIYDGVSFLNRTEAFDLGRMLAHYGRQI